MTHPHERALEAAARALDKYTLNKARNNTVARVAVSAYLNTLHETHTIVPREATAEMLEAAIPRPPHWPIEGVDKVSDIAIRADRAACASRYRAMIDAAPPAAQEPRP